MSIDISKIKVGDFVTVRAKCTGKGNINITLQDDESEYFWASLESIVGHEPAPEPLKVGDVVTIGSQADRFEIVAFHNETTWLYRENFGYLLCSEGKLRRVEP